MNFLDVRLNACRFFVHIYFIRAEKHHILLTNSHKVVDKTRIGCSVGYGPVADSGFLRGERKPRVGANHLANFSSEMH